MRELSLFSGAGGGLLGTKLLGWRAAGYVERDGYCQAVLEARIRDGLLDPAPIFGDVRAFLRDGWADRYRGLVDVVTAGFPCQPFSVAGKRKACGDERNLWPETAEVLKRVRPAFALLENVPGLFSARSAEGRNYFGTVLGDLAALGFDAEWGVLGAADVGAPHLRKRLWILAYRSGERRGEGRTESARQQGGSDAAVGGLAHAAEPGSQVGADGAGLRQRAAVERGGTQGALSDAERDDLRLERERERKQRGEPGSAEPGEDVHSDANSRGRQERRLEMRSGQRGASGGEPDGLRARGWRNGPDVDNANGERSAHGGEDEARSGELGGWAGDGEAAGAAGGGSWWERDPADEGPESESYVGRVAYGVACRVDRLRALGNGQVPAVVVRAWRELAERAGVLT